uniref:Uncharacterized protein n=1 Tax=Musa acuminata subsp. malaccensis TaxID=214687 RepID=A0A804HU38_MUSAM
MIAETEGQERGSRTSQRPFEYMINGQRKTGGASRLTHNGRR